MTNTNTTTPKAQVMLDLETMGTTPGSVIRAIGAVVFTRTGKVTATFYRRIDAQSCLDAGLTIDWDTVAWWLKQNDNARAEMTKPGESLKSVLCGFAAWIVDECLGSDNCELWGNGSDFDNAVLAAAFRAIRTPQPWRYHNNRCYRTMKNAYPQIRMERNGTHHNALADAHNQASHLADIWREQDRQKSALSLLGDVISHKAEPGAFVFDASPENTKLLVEWLATAREILNCPQAVPPAAPQEKQLRHGFVTFNGSFFLDGEPITDAEENALWEQAYKGENAIMWGVAATAERKRRESATFAESTAPDKAP